MSEHEKIRICIDRGGTFCDVYAETRSGKSVLLKLLSVDPDNYPDAPTEGIRRVLSHFTGEIPRNTPLPSQHIESIRLSTTIATNALLERKGEKHALVITKGFKDLLKIGNQARPRIFDLNIKRTEPLYDEVVEVDERVTLEGYTYDPNYTPFDPSSSKPGVVQGLSGESVQILKAPDIPTLTAQLQSLYDSGYTSLAVLLLHSYTYPQHEQLVYDIASKIGFTHISLSSSLLPMIKAVPRGMSATADAYLSPILMRYIDGFLKGFSDPKPHVEFMSSDGGLVDLRNFGGLRAVLSGPAGGVVGYALTSYDSRPKDPRSSSNENRSPSHLDTHRRPIIGLDVGGTSTDVSRYDGSFALTYESTTAGISITVPQLDINTVAAGGGSRLTFSQGLFRAGPESAGAHPGPVCYRKKGGLLALTDANLLLGRLVGEFFPKIFGEGEREGLDEEGPRREFEKLREEINEVYKASGQELSLDEIVYGFVKVANETMCRPIRALTEAKGYATSEHILASFGGAGGQHACEIAGLLGINTVVVHRYSSVLSAYGLALADRAYEEQEPCSSVYGDESLPLLRERLAALSKRVREELVRQGFEENRIKVERLLNMRFDGTDTALMVGFEEDGSTIESHDFLAAFKRRYKSEFGFVLEGKRIMVDDVKVRGVGKTFDTLGPSIYEQVEGISGIKAGKESEVMKGVQVNEFEYGANTSKAVRKHSVYFSPPVGRVDDTPVYLLGKLGKESAPQDETSKNTRQSELDEKAPKREGGAPNVDESQKLSPGDIVHGPAMIIDDTQTIVIVPGAVAFVTFSGLLIRLGDGSQR